MGNIQIARLLIENQADVNSRNMAGYSSLDFACKYVPPALKSSILTESVTENAYAHVYIHECVCVFCTKAFVGCQRRC